MKKRLFSLMLCLAMLIALFPKISATASAASDIPLGTYTNADYSSSVTFNADRTFSFVINFGEGFATVTGTYYIFTEDDGGITATLKVTSRHTGIVVDDTYNFSGAPKDDGNLYLTDGGAGIIPADTCFTIKKVSGNSGPTAEQITAGRAAIAASVKVNNEKFATSFKMAVASGHTYSGYRGVALESWAVKEVGIADSMNLMPAEVNDYFAEPISRVDFAALVYSALLRLTGMTESRLMSAVTLGSFPDCSDGEVKVCAGLGIISGTETGEFLPDNNITRQEAAAMLSRLAEAIGAKSTGGSTGFSDISGLWGESYIKNVSTLKDGYTGNAVMGGTGNNRFSPDDSYSRQQALVTIVRMVGVSAGGTSSSSNSSNDGSFEAVSAAVEAKANALWADGTLSGEDVQDILNFAVTMKEKGLVKNLVVDGTSVLYTTADGTPSGIVIDYGTESENGEATLGSGVVPLGYGKAESPTNFSLTAANDKLYLKNNKVLYITSFSKNDAKLYQPMEDGIQALRNKGYDVTVQNSASLTQYANIGCGDYGMIFIDSHGTVVDGQFYFWTTVDKDTAIADQKYLIGNQVRIINHIPGRDFGIYHFSREYFISPDFFANHLKSDPLDNTYVQFISCMSMQNQNMSNVFLANGANAVTGYNNTVSTSYAADVLELTAEKLSPANDQPDGDEVTVGELESGVLSKLGLHIFEDPFFNTETKTEDKRKGLTRFVSAGAESMILAVNNEAKPSAEAGLTISGTYSVIKPSFGNYKFDIKATITNNSNESIKRVDLSWEDYNAQPTGKRDPNTAIGSSEINETGFVLKPGESYTFEKSVERVRDTGYFSIIIPSYYTENYNKVVIPIENYKLFPLTKT